ncbi:4-hydroxythreonine-4-phosphate dehydrogenase [Sulfurospirillum sp. 1612]|uniref:4-hydroxythreonine-4-phosphate dehydrogenase n=1 Tax=Sulfurospirillum sp. 1612 TaxID=3094835 RepID=UPI002F91C549
MKKIAISIGDINGIGLEIALRAHEEISQLCKPTYCINKTMLGWGAAMLGLDVPEKFKTKECGEIFDIKPGIATKEAGEMSYDSFVTAIALAKSEKVSAIVTLPINKTSWNMAGIRYKGHTDALADLLGCKTIMMLGCDEMFVILYTHHIPLKAVSDKIHAKKLAKFLLDVATSVEEEEIAVLGLNPHAGDHGVIGDEESEITLAINKANELLGKERFIGPLVPDIAFSKSSRERYRYFVCMYHDQGLIPLKALYFEESINVTLNASIVRTSVDHGTAFDKAYKNADLSLKSYINAIKEAIK